MNETSLILEWALKSQWALDRSYLQKVFSVLTRHASGNKLSAEEIKAAIGDKPKQSAPYSLSKSGVATICVYGVICKRSSYISSISGPSGNACETLRSMVDQAMSDPNCKSIVFDIDSPGGSVDGVADLSDYIFDQRGKKPMTAFANGQMASAAYFIGSACDRIVTSQDAAVGSIGVYSILSDYSDALKEMGIKEEMIKAGKYKGLGHPDFPITDDTRKIAQNEVDAHYSNFVQAIARNRGIKVDAAIKLADGRHWIGAEAVKLGLADAVGTFQSVGGSVQPSSPSPFAKAEASIDAPKPEMLTQEKIELARAAVPVPKQSSRPGGRGTERSRKMSEENEVPASEALLLREASAEDVKTKRPALWERIGKEFIRAENEKLDRVKAMVAESGLDASVSSTLILACKDIPLEDAKVEINRVSAIEAALAGAKQIHGLDDTDIKCLREDVATLPQLSAVNAIGKFVAARKGAQLRLVKTPDNATNGKEVEQPAAEAAKKSTLSEAITVARGEFKQYAKVDPLGMANEKDYVDQYLFENKIEASDDEVKAIAPDLFK